MFCQKCMSKEATYHSTVNINGNISETHLCSECAVSEHKMNNNIFNVGSFFAKDFDLKNGNKLNDFGLMCKDCGFTYDEFLETGLLGCPKCYHYFLNKLLPVIKTMQPNAMHVGKKPLEIYDEVDKESVAQKIRNLEYKLKQAVALENYELASSLKKQINELKNEGEQNG